MSGSAGRPEPELTVLLAEDNDDHALLIEMALERATTRPINFHRARNGDEAVELVRELRPDLMLLDLKMPKLDDYTKKMADKWGYSDEAIANILGPQSE